MSWELYIPPEVTIKKRSLVTGRFLKGHSPFNKGRRAKEYMSEDSYKRMLAGLSRKGNPNIGGMNKREIVAFKNDKIIGFFESSSLAGRKLNVCDRNIRTVCYGKRKTAGGYRFFFSEDYEKYKHLLKI